MEAPLPLQWLMAVAAVAEAARVMAMAAVAEAAGVVIAVAVVTVTAAVWRLRE